MHARSHTGARKQERSSALPSAATARDSFALGAAEAQSASAVFDGDGKGGSGRAQNLQNSNERTTRLADRLQPGGVPDQPRPIAAQPRKGGCAPREASVASSADETDAAGASVRARRLCARSRMCGRALERLVCESARACRGRRARSEGQSIAQSHGARRHTASARGRRWPDQVVAEPES